MDPISTSTAEPQMPLFLDNPIMRNMPGITTSMAFSSRRGMSTLINGGFLESQPRTAIGRSLTKRRLSRFRMMDPETGLINKTSAGHFIGGRGKSGILSRRAEKLVGAGEKGGFLRGAKVNNFTARPRALGRYSSVSVFTEKGYTPFGASKMIGNNRFIKSAFANSGIAAGKDEALFGPGLISFIGAGRKADILESKAISGNARALKKLKSIDRNVNALMTENVPDLTKRGTHISQNVLKGKAHVGEAHSLVTPTTKTIHAGEMIPENARLIGSTTEKAAAGRPLTKFEEMLNKSLSFGPAESSVVPSQLDRVVGKKIGEGGLAGIGGTRGNLLASSMAGSGTRFVAGYFRGAAGYGGQAGLFNEALKGAGAAESRFGEAFAKAFKETKGFKGIAAEAEKGVEFLRGTAGKSLFRELGAEGIGKIATSGGGRVLAARAGYAATKYLSPIGTAMMLYDLGKMAGDVVKGGINLAKDSITSMKGSISKPLFGMGYKDTEAAATSRARGVMAIQNSQLNARSILGSEAGMLAAHFG